MIKSASGDIILREFTSDDKYRMAELANNAKIAINLRDGFPHPYKLSDAENFITMCLKLEPPRSILAIEYKGEYAGNIGLMKGTDVYRKSAEIGYFLGESYWGKGIMTEAVKLICEFGFRELDIIRIHTGIFEYNTASQKVLIKCGFQQEGIFKNSVFKWGRIVNEIRFALVLEDSTG